MSDVLVLPEKLFGDAASVESAAVRYAAALVEALGAGGATSPRDTRAVPEGATLLMGDGVDNPTVATWRLGFLGPLLTGAVRRLRRRPDADWLARVRAVRGFLAEHAWGALVLLDAPELGGAATLEGLDVTLSSLERWQGVLRRYRYVEVLPFGSVARRPAADWMSLDELLAHRLGHLRWAHARDVPALAAVRGTVELLRRSSTEQLAERVLAVSDGGSREIPPELRAESPVIEAVVREVPHDRLLQALLRPGGVGRLLRTDLSRQS